MELIKFLNELKNNKYLTLNQLENDINKLKTIVDNPKLKFDYVKPKGIKNYINDLKSAADYSKKKLLQTASDAYSAMSKIIPKYQPKSDDDIYLILGFLLFLDDDEIDSFYESNDDIFALIGMLLIDTKTPRKNQPLDRQFRQKLIRLPYNVIFNTFTNFTDPTYIMEAILNQIFSFLILSTYLLQDNKVCFSSQDVEIQPNDFLTQLNITDKNKFVSIGLGNALGQWKNKGQTNLFNVPVVKLNSQAAASYTSIQMMKNVLQELYTSKIVDLGSGEQGHVGIKQDNTPNKYSSTCLHVWGANINNYNLDDNTQINGLGQATAFNRGNGSSQSPGVFGIISTNANMESIHDNNDRYKTVLKKRWEWLNIENKDYVLFYNVLKTIIACNLTNDISNKIGVTVTQLFEYINGIMTSIPDYDNINRQFIDIHSTLYTEAKTVPENHNQIIISYDKESQEFSLMTIKVIINDENSNLFYDRDNKYLNLNLEKLKDACLKQDNTITFYNLEDLEEYIDHADEEDDEDEDNDDDKKLQNNVDSAKSEMNHLLEQIRRLEQENERLITSGTANKENINRLKIERTAMIAEQNAMLDLIIAEKNETRHLLKEQENKYTKLTLDKSRIIQNNYAIKAKFQKINFAIRRRMKAALDVSNRLQAELITSRSALENVTDFAEKSELESARLELELNAEKADAFRKQTLNEARLTALMTDIAEYSAALERRNAEIRSLQKQIRENTTVASNNTIMKEQIDTMTEQSRLDTEKIKALSEELLNEKTKSTSINAELVKKTDASLSSARAELNVALAEKDAALAEASSSQSKKEAALEKLIQARREAATAHEAAANARLETNSAYQLVAEARQRERYAARGVLVCVVFLARSSTLQAAWNPRMDAAAWVSDRDETVSMVERTQFCAVSAASISAHCHGTPIRSRR
jgi:hypothetical protein